MLTTQPAPIAVFTALTWESAAVRSILRQVKRVEEKVWRGSTGTREVLVITGGIGWRRTRHTVERFAATPLSKVLSVGCAGALVPGLRAGQLILASTVQVQPAKDEDRMKQFCIDPRLFAQLRTAATRIGAPMAEGPLLTSPKALFTVEEKTAQGERTGAIAVEMESGVHAEFAAQRALPFLVVRVILDGVDMAIPAVVELTTSDGEVRRLQAARYVLTHPQHFSALWALKQARAIAARSLARLCQALFSQLSE